MAIYMVPLAWYINNIERKLPLMTQTTITTTYNGWKNYETWNVALWIQNDQGWHDIACEVTGYKMWLRNVAEGETADGVNLFGADLDVAALDDMILEM